jgi:hypothetical protein
MDLIVRGSPFTSTTHTSQKGIADQLTENFPSLYETRKPSSQVKCRMASDSVFYKVGSSTQPWE